MPIWQYFLLLLKISDGIKIYRSTLQIFDENSLSGLHYSNYQNFLTFSNSFSACIRFNYKRLAGSFAYGRSRIFHFPNQNFRETFFKAFVGLSAEYPGTWFHLGNYERNNSYSNWILLEPPNSHDIWSAYKWHHLCFSFAKSKSLVTLVKVSYNKSKRFPPSPPSPLQFFCFIFLLSTLYVEAWKIFKTNEKSS